MVASIVIISVIGFPPETPPGGIVGDREIGRVTQSLHGRRRGLPWSPLVSWVPSWVPFTGSHGQQFIKLIVWTIVLKKTPSSLSMN